MHGVEAPYLFGETSTYRMTLEDGSVARVACRHYGFEGWAQRYDRVAGLPAQGPEMRVGPVLQAAVRLLDVRALWDRAEAAMRRDPYYLVERKAIRHRRVTPRPPRDRPSWRRDRLA